MSCWEGEDFGDEITEEEAEEILQDDIASAEASARRLVDVQLTENQFSAVVCLIFNVGQRRFRRSKTRILINARDADTFREWFDFYRAGGKPLLGLMRRRMAEIELWFKQ